MRILLILILSSAIASCGLHRPSKCGKYVDTNTVITVDTVEKHTRDTIRIAGDTLSIHDTIKVDCIEGKPVFKPSSQSFHQGSAHATVNINSNGQLNITIACDSLVQVIDSLEYTIKERIQSTHLLKGGVEAERALKERWRLSFFVLAGVLLAFLIVLRLFK